MFRERFSLLNRVQNLRTTETYNAGRTWKKSRNVGIHAIKHKGDQGDNEICGGNWPIQSGVMRINCTVDQLERKIEEDFVEPAPSDTWHLAEGTRVGECHDEQKQSQDRIGLA